MSVNIFGSSGASNASSGLNNKYVDQKFRTLSANLATKVNKTGDTISGNLNILNVCQLGGDNTKSLFYTDIVMNNKFINNLRNPNEKQDTATKHYVDTRYIKSFVGYIPNLTSNTNKNGFIVSASSEYFESQAYNVSNDNQDCDWITVHEKTNFWIQIKCPEKVRIYKIRVRGLTLRDSNGIIKDKISFNWKWQGSNDGSDWTNINEFAESMIGNEILDVPVNCSAAYLYYRIFVNKADIDNPGLS